MRPSEKFSETLVFVYLCQFFHFPGRRLFRDLIPARKRGYNFSNIVFKGLESGSFSRK